MSHSNSSISTVVDLLCSKSADIVRALLTYDRFTFAEVSLEDFQEVRDKWSAVCRLANHSSVLALRTLGSLDVCTKDGRKGTAVVVGIEFTQRIVRLSGTWSQ